jgi:hypothetical protein
MIGQNSFTDLNDKFIIGQSGVPDNVKLSKLLNFDVLTTAWTPIYDCDQGQIVVYATKDGAEKQNVKLGRYFANTNSIIEPEGFSASVFEKAVDHILTEILTNLSVPVAFSKREAIVNIERWDLRVSSILTRNELSIIPDGMGLAITEPEFLGVIYVRGDTDKIATEWGAFIFNIDRAITLFNINASTVQIETTILNFIENCIKNEIDYYQYYEGLEKVKLSLIESGHSLNSRTEEILKEKVVREIHNS